MYTISYPSGTIRLDGVVVEPDSPAWQGYRQFLQGGGGPEPAADPQAQFPRIEVSAWQIRKALNATGLRDAVEQAVAASASIELKDGWNYAPTFFSDNALTIALGAGLGKTPADMYALFQLASSL